MRRLMAVQTTCSKTHADPAAFLERVTADRQIVITCQHRFSVNILGLLA